MISQSFIDQFRKAQKQLVLDLSRPIIVGFSSSQVENCPNCFYDGMSESSSTTFSNFSGTVVLFAGTSHEISITPRPFKQVCPVCRGVGQLTVPLEKTIMASVNWEYPDDDTNFSTAAGDYKHHVVTIKSDSKYYQDFVNAAYFIVDGVKVDPVSKPVIRSLKVANGIVEMLCSTVDVEI